MDEALEARIAKFEADMARAAQIAERRIAELRETLDKISSALLTTE